MAARPLDPSTFGKFVEGLNALLSREDMEFEEERRTAMFRLVTGGDRGISLAVFKNTFVRARSGVEAETTQLSPVATPQVIQQEPIVDVPVPMTQTEVIQVPREQVPRSTSVFSTPEKVVQKPVGIVVEAPRPEIDEKAIEASPPVTCEKWIASTRSRKHESLLLDSDAEHADHFCHHACTNTNIESNSTTNSNANQLAPTWVLNPKTGIFEEMPQIQCVDEVADVVHEDITGKWLYGSGGLFGFQSYEIKSDCGRLLFAQGTLEGVLSKATLDKEDWLEAPLTYVGQKAGGTIRLCYYVLDRTIRSSFRPFGFDR